MGLMCTTCDIRANSKDDSVFDLCKQKNHEILELLDETSSPTENKIASIISELPLDEYQKKLSEQLQNLKLAVEGYFPDRYFTIEACLSVKAQMKIEGITQVFPLILMGQPSSYKSTILEIISSLPDCYFSDAFTPKSFVSHSANSKKEQLGKIDLLPKIKHKTLITPELAPLFSGNQDQLIEYFGILTRILDGRGYQSDSGVHGKRGYVGDYSFTWLGAVVDIPYKVWRVLGNLGAKIYFLRLPDDHRTGQGKRDLIKQNLKEDSYISKLKVCKKAAKRLWDLVENRPNKQEGKTVWDTERDDKETFDRIVDLSMVLARLRASIPTWYTSSSDSGGSNYHFETPIIEEPQRAASALYNLARGHALLCGRNYITKDDLRVVIPVALSSASRERVDLFRLLIENNGQANTDQFQEGAKVSRATALKEMERLSRVGLVDKTEEEADTKPITLVKLKPEYGWFLTPEFRTHWNKFKASLTPKNSKLSQTGKVENLEKNGVSETQETLDCLPNDDEMEQGESK